MDRRRLQLHKELIEKIGSNNVYYQPPASKRMDYPCIRYELTAKDTRHANDKKYLAFKAYRLTIIDTDPDSNIPELIEEFRYCEFDRFYSTDNLNHWVYILYY